MFIHKINVDAYSGYRLNEKPLAVFLETQWLEVKEIIDRWYGIGYMYFKVLLSDDKRYILKYDEWDHIWEGWLIEKENTLK